MPVTAGKPAKLSLVSNLFLAAKDLKINQPCPAEDGQRRAVSKARAAQWQAGNAKALESSNRHVEEFGLPLEQTRQF